MPDAIVRVFVSSTWLDLGPERAAVKEAVERLRETKFIGMEHFGSRDETTRRASLDEVARSHVYVGLFAARHGSGITADEYRHAREHNLPCLIYFKDDASIPADLRETDPAQTAKLDALKQELRAAHTIGPPFASPPDLAARVTADLHRWLFDHYLTPRLEAALRGEVSHSEAQTLLDTVKDLSALSRVLLERLQGAGFSVAIAGDFVARDKVTNIYNAPALAISALHQLPPPPRDFTGRKQELDELRAGIERGGATISGLHGFGGIGKTTLALKLAEELKPRYPDAQFYLDLKGASPKPLTVAEILSHVVRAYHPTAKLPEGEAELRALYFSVLDGQRAILLMDNASGREQVEPLIPPGGCVLLVTSRQHFTLPGLSAKNLDTLPPADARQLLLTIAPRIGEQADELARLCGHLPLALRLAASALAERLNLTAADYVRRLEGTQKRVELIEASLNLSYELLTPELQKLWRALAVFPDTFDLQAAAAVWEAEADAAQDTLGELVRYSLVDWNEGTARYRLHDLARLFADARLSHAERDRARMRHAVHYLDVIGAADDLYQQGGESIELGLALYDLELKNIQAGQAWAEKQSGENDEAASICSAYPRDGTYLLALRQHPREKIRWRTTALAAARRLKNRGAEGAHLGNLGLAYSNVGETRRAVEYHEQHLVITREIGDRRGEAAALGNMGVAYKNLGETRRAIEYFKQQLTITREIGDRRGEGNALGNMGVAYKSLGETRRAIEYYEQRLVIAREIGDRRGEGNALGNLGNAYADLDDLRRAIRYYEQNLAISREMGNRRSEGIALGNIGVAYKELGETRRAIEYYEQNLAIAREVSDRHGEGTALINIAIALNNLGDRTRALAHAEEALEILEQIESPHVVKARNAIAEWRGQK